MSQSTTTPDQAITTSLIPKPNPYEPPPTDSNSILMKMIKQLGENMAHVAQGQLALEGQMLGMQEQLGAVKKDVTALAIKMEKSDNSSSDYSNRSRSSSRSQFERNRTERRRRRVQELDFARAGSEAEEANQPGPIRASNPPPLNPPPSFTGGSKPNPPPGNLAPEEIAKVKLEQLPNEEKKADLYTKHPYYQEPTHLNDKRNARLKAAGLSTENPIIVSPENIKSEIPDSRSNLSITTKEVT